MKRRMFASLLSAALLVQSFGVFPASAEETNSVQNFVYDDYEVSYQVTNSWGDTEVVSITLSNTGDSTIEDWMLYFDPNGEVQYTTDCQQLTTSDGISYFKNSGYNADVAPDSSVTFGYAVNDCEAVPESFTLCQKRETKTDGYTVSLNVNQSWGDSFSGEIVIQNNTDTAIEAWELTIDTNFTITKITNSWAASVTELEPYSYLLKGTYTGTVAANSSVSLGFIGVKDGEPEISSYSLTEVQVDADYVTLLHCYEDWENLPDTDGDGLPDLYEQLIGTDAAVADTDQDQLPDGYEVKTLNSDPTNANSLDVTQNDGAYDSDKDGLSNYEEYTLGTDPLTADSDHDGLSDGDEVNTYGADPLKSDTDGDGLSDGDEIALGLNPLVVDTDGDGIPDNEEKIEQSLSYTEEDTTTPIREVTLSFCGTGNISSTTEITPVDDNVFVSNVAGIIGKPFQFTSSSVFETAEVSFYVDTNCLDEVTFDNLGVLWYNEAYQRFELLSCNYDDETSTIHITVPHFSIYCLVNKKIWMDTKTNGTFYFEAEANLTDADADGMPDCYESTNSETPETVFSLANGDTYYSLKDTTDSDGDTIADGKEILFSTVGDVNCDGTISEDDVTALQAYLGGTETLSKIALVQADCNIDGTVDEKDLELLKNYLTNAKKELADGVNLYALGMLTEGYGDLNEDGVCDVNDVVILQSFLLERETESFNNQNADLIADGILNVSDLVLLKRFVLLERELSDVSLTGYSFFYCVSNPMSEDTDGDLDFDNADPDPLSYQLNGYFAQKMGELQKAAQVFFNCEPSKENYNDGYSNMTDVWLSFYYIRQFEPSYNSDNWLNVGGSQEGWQNKFISFLEERKEYASLVDYFNTTESIYANADGELVDLHHLAATMTAQIFRGFYNTKRTRTLAGWAGDIRQLMNSAYNLTYLTHDFSDIFDAFYSRMGNNADYFGTEDFYGDVDAVNLFTIFDAAYPEEYADGVSIESLMNDYYGFGLNHRVDMFCVSDSISYDTVCDYTFVNGIDGIFKKEYNFSDLDRKKCANAFIRYLNTNYHQSIEEGSLD